MVAAAAHPNAELRLTGVGVNPSRSGIVDALRAMGAKMAVEEGISRLYAWVQENKLLFTKYLENIFQQFY